MTTTQKIDRVVTNRWLGLPIFIVIMFARVLAWRSPSARGVVTDWANDGISGDGWPVHRQRRVRRGHRGMRGRAFPGRRLMSQNILGEDEESELPCR